MQILICEFLEKYLQSEHEIVLINLLDFHSFVIFLYCKKAFPFFFLPVYIICILQHLSCYLLKQNKTEQKKDQKGETPRE